MKRLLTRPGCPRGRGPGSGGFTLLEITVALAVIAIAALGVLSCLTTGYTIDREAADTITAQNLSRRVIEELLGAPFDDLIPNYDNTQVDNEGFRATIRAQQVLPAAGSPSLIRLQVAVRVDGDNRDLVKVVTLRSDHRAPASAWLTRP